MRNAGPLTAYNRYVLAFAFWCLLGLAGTSVAFGAQGHAFLRAFPGKTSPPVELSLVSEAGSSGLESGVAVSAATGDVFVADTGHHRIDVFAASGGFLRAWGWGVQTGASELQVCTSACLTGLSGSAAGEFELPVFVSVDNDAGSASFGDVYVGDAGNELVSKFDAEGHLVSSWGNNGENAGHERVEPNGQLNGEISPDKEPFDENVPGARFAGATVDGAGNLWVLDRASVLFEFNQGGAFVTKCDQAGGVGSKGIVAGSTGIYVADGVDPVSRVPFGKCAELTPLTTGAMLRRAWRRGTRLVTCSSTGRGN